MFEDCTQILKGYGSVDNVLESCEKIGLTLRTTISSWTTERNPNADENADEGALSLLSIKPLKNPKAQNYLTSQPKLLAQSVVLKEYQLLGVNWLNLLYRSSLSCILADEMGMYCHQSCHLSMLISSRSRQNHSGHQFPRLPQGTGQEGSSSHSGAVCSSFSFLIRHKISI